MPYLFWLAHRRVNGVKCIEAGDPAAISSTCAEWTRCLSARNQTMDLTSFLRAAVETAVPSVIPATATYMTAKPDNEQCVDPSIADPESWECDCLSHMKRTCKGLNKSLDACLPGLMCHSGHVCQSWKQTHCSAAMMEVRNSSFQGMMITQETSCEAPKT